jgi:predicted TIM-barrel fold metal-dependent hydrolase
MFSEPPFKTALLTFGIDRIIFSVDYPYSSNAKGRAFLDRLSLAGRHGQGQPRQCGCAPEAQSGSVVT